MIEKKAKPKQATAQAITKQTDGIAEETQITGQIGSPIDMIVVRTNFFSQCDKEEKIQTQHTHTTYADDIN